MKKILATALAISLFFQPVVSLAQSNLDDASGRLRFLQSSLDQEVQRNKTWLWWWGVIQGGLTVGQLVAVPFSNHDDQLDWYVGAGSSALGLATFWIIPYRIHSINQQMQALRSDLNISPDGTTSVAQAEKLMDKAIAIEKESHGIFAHLTNVILDVGAGAIIYFGFDHKLSGAITAGSGVVLGEILILTQPNHLKYDLEAYQQGAWRNVPGVQHSESGPRWAMAPWIGKDQYGLGVRIDF